MQLILLVCNSVECCEKALEDSRDPEDQCFLFSHSSTTVPFHILERRLKFSWVRR